MLEEEDSFGKWRKKELDLQETLSLQSLVAESEPEGSFPHSEPNFVIFLESNNGKMPLRYNSAAQRRIWGCILCDQIESCRS